MNLDSSERSKELGLRISKFMDEHVFPSEKIYSEQMEESTKQGNRWQIPQIIEDKKKIAKKEGLWNLFLPENPMGESMSNLDYAPLAELMGSVHSDIEIKGNPAIILVAGLQGSGKTTFTGKLALL